MIRTLLLSVVTLLSVSALPAQEQRRPNDDMAALVDQLRQDVNAPPRVPLLRIESPPTVDGRLDDEVWSRASRIEDLRQVVPIEGAVPSERTEVAFLYDSDFLYIGVRCFDEDSASIVATQMQRDANLGPDDRVRVVIDTFHDRRNAFLFEINPVGARTDGIIENSANPNRNYDGIWYGRAQIDDEGWTAEIAIPFKTVSFDPSTEQWGFNVERVIKRKAETIRWSSPLQDSSLQFIGDAGIITEIRGIEQGLGLDVVPYATSRFRRIGGDDSFEFDAGLDAFYRVTPSLTAAVTVNTDFSAAEVDERRVNLTRVPLFFPERRDFFLRDTGIFNFGGINSDPRPFFSRRIGIGPNGAPVDVLAGLKLTGRVGPVNVGLLDVYLDDGFTSGGEKIRAQNVAVGRVSVNVLEESTVGLIGTFGDPTSNDQNGLIGGDFNFRSSSLFGDKTLTANVWFQKTFSEQLSGDDTAWGVRASYPNDIHQWSFGVAEVRKNYNPGLGFTRRFGRGIREFFGRYRFRIRPSNSWIRTIDFSLNGFAITDLSFTLETGNVELDILEITNQIGDRLELSLIHEGEFLTDPFTIFDGVTIEPGRFAGNRVELDIETSTARPVSLDLSVGIGDFFNGSRTDFSLGVTWRASKHFFFGVEYEQNDIDLPAGAFTTRIARLRANVFFTPDISWNTFVQYDNVSDIAGINSRFRWIIEPGRELFFVVNQGLVVDERFKSSVTDVTMKLAWTFRF